MVLIVRLGGQSREARGSEGEREAGGGGEIGARRFRQCVGAIIVLRSNPNSIGELHRPCWNQMRTSPIHGPLTN
ncbi:hypothetical protein BHM03_00002797 [Ensete ventricosum]|nr:hypothetical protein BHM03_00002797 [Ensete ventricosum]